MITIYKKTGSVPVNEYSSGRSLYYMSGVISFHSPKYAHIWSPPTDIYETEDEIVILVEIAGMTEEGFNISVDQKSLTISGSRPNPEVKRVFFQMELNYGEFRVDVDISKPIDVDRTSADYSDGFLKVCLPKSKPKQVNVHRE
jgi:HSP20 family protein